MNEIPKVPTPLSVSLSGGVAPARGAQPSGAQPSGATDGAQTTTPAFEALLERLTTRAAELEKKSKTLSEPAELPAAMDAARSSLEDALKLGNDLLEAYRAAQQNGPEGAP